MTLRTRLLGYLHGHPGASIREMGAAVGASSSSTIHSHLTHLARKRLAYRVSGVRAQNRAWRADPAVVVTEGGTVGVLRMLDE